MQIEDCFFDTSDYEPTGENLGKGSYGIVYLVKKNDVLYAAKIITPKGVFNSHDQMMFLRESLILHKLNHPAIVKFYGINFHSFEDQYKLSPTILTEYYSNGSLRVIFDNEKNHIIDKNWTPTKKYICLLGISDAMRYLYKEGILHRDLKPGNILIDSNYYPKVCDFGLSKCFSNALTNSMQFSMTGTIGSPLYTAPELYDDEEHYSPAVDVYSFALLAYEIVTNIEPFSVNGKSASLKEIINKVTNGVRPEFTDNITEKMKNLIEKCWSQDPKERPSFEEIFDTLSSEFSYSTNETLNEEEIKEYLKILEESRNINKTNDNKETSNLHLEIEKLKTENQNYKEQLTQKDEEIKKLLIELDKFKNQNLNNSKCLHIKICEAQKILSLHRFAKSCPYISLRLKSQDKEDEICTGTILTTNNPVWNEEFNIISSLSDDVLIINMFDEDPKGDEQLIDQLEFPVNE